MRRGVEEMHGREIEARERSPDEARTEEPDHPAHEGRPRDRARGRTGP